MTDKASFGADLTDAVLEYFGYDGQDLLFDILDADGTDGNAPVLSKRYLQGPAVDQILTQENALLATNDPNRTLWLTTDHLGSVRDVLRNDGTIAAHYQYDSFGAPLDGLENITKFGYAGYERDTTTGYYRTQTRWYDPRSGKWISEDWSLGPDSNPYRYVHNGATNFVDANGRQEHEPLLPDEYFADGLGLRPGEQLEDPDSYGAGVGHVFWGYGKAIVGTRDAAIAAGTDPFGTVGNTASALWNFRQTASMVCEDFATKLSSLEGQGEIVGDALIGVFTGAAAKKLVTAGRLGSKLDNLPAPTTRGFWDSPPQTRWATVEQRLGANLPFNYPTIDRFAKGVATSIKSMDIGASTYANPGAITRVGQGYIDKLASFKGANWAGTSVRAADIQKRVLDLAVPPGASEAQRQALNGLRDCGAKRGVTVNIHEIQ